MIDARPPSDGVDSIVLLPLCGAAIASFVACTTFARSLGLSVTTMVVASSLSFAVYAAALFRASRRPIAG